MSKAERTKRFIIEKTAPIFNTKGYAGTSLNDMTDATGLTKGSIYGNFSNKDEVALAAFDYNLEILQSRFKQEIDKQKTYKAKLLAFPKTYENYLDHPFVGGGCPILNTAIEADDTHPLLKQAALKAFNSWKTSLVNLINKGIEAKEFKSNVDPEQTALTIIATIEGAVMIAKLTDKINNYKSILNSIKKMIEELS